jgi:CDP-glucose 4,6-dehydratase
VEDLVGGVYSGRRVLVTGHTGFKGGWLSLWLQQLGADVTGYSLPAPDDRPSVFTAANVGKRVRHVEGDVRDRDHLLRIWTETRPEVVFHLAAQALVRESYRAPIETVTTNVLGTVNVLETARVIAQPVVLVLITSDKCYENHERDSGYAENDELGGADMYSGSKAAAEILISGYRRSFFKGMDIAVASTRAGNVIGGGDWSDDRIVPDAIRSLCAGRPIDVRNPAAVRPWQHVLEPLSGYLQLGARMLSRDDERLCSPWNFGPTIENSRTVRDLVERIVTCWGSGTWRDASSPGALHEATLLRLDITKAARDLGWAPRWDFGRAIEQTVAWYKAFDLGERMDDRCLFQIREYVLTANRQVHP